MFMSLVPTITSEMRGIDEKLGVVEIIGKPEIAQLVALLDQYVF